MFSDIHEAIAYVFSAARAAYYESVGEAPVFWDDLEAGYRKELINTAKFIISSEKPTSQELSERHLRYMATQGWSEDSLDRSHEEVLNNLFISIALAMSGEAAFV